MKETDLELRMYFFVPYNISPIQQAIQAGHSALEYALYYGNTDLFRKFADKWKAWIILNGGTTNEKRDLDGIALGSLNQIGDSLLENKINFMYFNEPDLQDALTAVCFICDERVFNYKDYPDFINWYIETVMSNATSQQIVELKMIPVEDHLNFVHYSDWVKFMGGPKNVFLRELIKGKKLA